MSFDIISYILGNRKGYSKGYEEGVIDGASDIVLTGSITCTDDGNGNITITEDN